MVSTSVRSRLGSLYARLPAWTQRAVTRAYGRAAPGRAAEASWAGRSETAAAGYWDSIELPHRAWLMEELRRFEGAASFLELGCSAGPNLRLLADELPGARLSGIDVNAQAIELARRRFAEQGVTGVQLRLGSFREVLGMLDERSEDLLFSCYALAYVAPRELRGVLEQVLRIARTGLVLAEPQAMPGAPAGRTNDVPEWRHDYAAELRALGLADRAIEVRTLPPEGPGLLNACLSADLRRAGDR